MILPRAIKFPGFIQEEEHCSTRSKKFQRDERRPKNTGTQRSTNPTGSHCYACHRTVSMVIHKQLVLAMCRIIVNGFCSSLPTTHTNQGYDQVDGPWRARCAPRTEARCGPEHRLPGTKHWHLLESNYPKCASMSQTGLECHAKYCDEIRLSVEFVTVGFLGICRHSCCD